MTLMEQGAAVLSLAAKQLAGAQAEVFLVEAETRVQEFSEGKPENLVQSQSHGLGLRLIQNGRLGFSHTNRWDDSALRETVTLAAAGAQSTAPDDELSLPPLTKSSAPDLELVDSSLRAETFAERAAFLSALEADVRKRDPRLTSVLRATFTESRVREAVVNSTGTQEMCEGTQVAFSLACVAVENNETQIGYGFQTARHGKALDPAWVVNHAVEHTLSLLGGKQVPSGLYDVVLDPFVAGEMLDLLATALRADQVLKGRSFLAKRIGESVAARCMTLIDDGRLPRGLGTSPFDAEGSPTQTTEVLREGVLQTFLYDTRSARKLNHTSTGNAVRGSYKSVPEPGTTNFYLKPGTRTPQDMILNIKSGIYVRNVMGLHTVDTVSGDYSLGLSGEYIQNGKRVHAVRGVTMAGNLMDLLKQMEAVGSDLIFSGAVGSPTLWIRDVSIGGS